MRLRDVFYCKFFEIFKVIFLTELLRVTLSNHISIRQLHVMLCLMMYLHELRNVNSDFSVVTMRRIAIIFFELAFVKKFHAKILIARHFMIISFIKNCAQEFHVLIESLK